ncbi:MAG TPA: transcriptional repressor [Polyangiaceae bacterium]|jgi:Fur family ferric uptake transcriptional regulator|nr:transcriptional repressor [Polyangiaceae bacterium]
MSAKARLLRDDDLRTLLSSQKLRVTEQRMLILRELARLRVPVSHPELTERLTESRLDRATIYRNLISMSEAGLLVRTQLGDAVWRYELPHELSATHGTHPHFVCANCGDVTCLSESAVTLQGDVMKNQVAEVQLRGLCAACVR